MQHIEDEVQSVEQSPEPTQEKAAIQAAEPTTYSDDDAHLIDKGTFHDLIERFEDSVEGDWDWLSSEARTVWEELKGLVPKP